MLIKEFAHQLVCSSESVLIRDHAHQRAFPSESMFIRDLAHQRACSSESVLIRDHTCQVKQSELLNTSSCLKIFLHKPIVKSMNDGKYISKTICQAFVDAQVPSGYFIPLIKNYLRLCFKESTEIGLVEQSNRP